MFVKTKFELLAILEEISMDLIDGKTKSAQERLFNARSIIRVIDCEEEITD